MKQLNCQDIAVEESLSTWQKEVLEQFKAKMTDKNDLFPCIPATIGFSLNQLRYGFLKDSIKHNTVQELAKLLGNFTEHADEYGDYTSLIVFYDLPEEVKKTYTVEQYEQLFWQQLNELVEYDEIEWPNEIPREAQHPLWEFCFHGERYFMYCATPAHSNRNSRSFPTLMLAITPRWVFQKFNKTKHADKIIHQVRTRLQEYDTISRHPELRTYGDEDNFEWKQYFLRDENITLAKCPFHNKKIVTGIPLYFFA